MQSYPSPTAAAANNGGPFYSNISQNQQQTDLPNPDELQLTAQLTSMISVAPNGTISDNQASQALSRTNASHQYENEQDQNAHLQPTPNNLDQLGGHYGTPDGILAPRKRTKVSRACDECRRKKIRCDATTDQNNENCLNCKRVGARCLFSRVPMKRGPSKGYIKELADRLHTLEGAMHSGEIVSQFISQGENPILRRDSEEFTPPHNTDNVSMKRRISATTDFGPYSAQQSLASWNSNAHDTSRQILQSSNGLVSPQTAIPRAPTSPETATSPGSLQAPIWRDESMQFRQQNGTIEDISQDQVSPKKDIKIDNMTLEAYDKFIKPTYCILPLSKSQVIKQLENCPVPLYEAMCNAISSAVNSFLLGDSSHQIDSFTSHRSTQYILVSSLEDATSRPLKINILYLQSMLLLAIAAENNTFGHPRVLGGYSRSIWINNAISLAYSIKLFLHRPRKVNDVSTETDEHFARRLWWSIYVMERWNSASTSSPFLIPDSASVLYPDDLPLLGETLWNLARLSTILGHISTIITVSSDLPPFTVPLASVYSASVKGELERFRESFLNIESQPLVLMAYWHLRILVELQLVDSEPNDLVDIVTNAINHMSQNPDFDSPLRYHFISLIILTLIELLDYEMTKSQSETQLDFIFGKKLISPDWEVVVRTMVMRKRTHRINTSLHPMKNENDLNFEIENLVRLADLATAAGANREADPGVSNTETSQMCSPFRYYNQLRSKVRDGYLTVFAHELVRIYKLL
ncbi:putative glucose-responsive transcription factor [Erysiphe necator]|uniref:Putative glucose-responsive transcription factor n=1 Tax=Uncinula necator TaxID=52586 RepID=A0A0B1P2L5_UNCNE|nr:putative glucose-responsive transcription factor [Erysiphe necator]